MLNRGVQELHLQTVTEVLQSIKALDMTPMLQRIFQTEGGSDALDVLMKYLLVCLFKPISAQENFEQLK